MTKQTAKREAESLGHKISRFETVKSSRGTKLYSRAYCLKCEAALFAEEITGTGSRIGNPALNRKCETVS